MGAHMRSMASPRPSRAARTRWIKWASVPSPAPTRIFTALKWPRSMKPVSSAAIRSADAQPPEA